MIKNTLLKSILVLSSFSLLYSCKKNEDTNTDQLASLGKATITGKVTAHLVDTIGAASSQNAPAGTVVNAWVDTKDYVLNPNGGVNYAKRYFSATTDASGYYTLSVEVSKYQSAIVHVEPASFEYNVMKKHTTGPDAGDLYSDRHVFNAIAATVTINNNEKAIKDINYN